MGFTEDCDPLNTAPEPRGAIISENSWFYARKDGDYMMVYTREEKDDDPISAGTRWTIKFENNNLTPLIREMMVTTVETGVLQAINDWPDTQDSVFTKENIYYSLDELKVVLHGTWCPTKEAALPFPRYRLECTDVDGNRYEVEYTFAKGDNLSLKALTVYHID